MSVLITRGAGVRRRRRWLFRELDLTVEPGEFVALTGPPGSGRTTLLLALMRRFRLSAGTVEIGGTAALGHVPEVTGPEAVFTVTEHVRERLALLGRPRSEAAAADLLGLDPHAKGRDLTPFQRQLLGLVLARLSEPAVIGLDGLDDGLDAREQATLRRLLTDIAAAGTAVLFTAREIDPEHATTIVRLGDTASPDGRPESKSPSDDATADADPPDADPAGTNLEPHDRDASAGVPKQRTAADDQAGGEPGERTDAASAADGTRQ